MNSLFLWMRHTVAPATFLLLFSITAHAQSLSANYTFSQGFQAYISLTGGTVLGTATNDNQLFSGIPIGFFISVNGVAYNTAGVSSNGFIWFGNTAPSTTNFTPISSTEGSAAYICAFAKNLESRSAAGAGELRTRTTGLSPNRIFTVQWKNYQRYTSGVSDNGDIFNFQVKMYEYNQRIEVIYGPMTTTLNGNAQVGLRGNSNSNFLNRVVNATNIWNNSVAGTVNTATAAYTTTRLPATGLTYRWVPTSLLNTTVSGSDVDTVTNSMPNLLNTNNTLTASFTDEGGITSLGIQRFINGASQPWVAMTKLSGDNISGTWQVQLPAVNVNADVVYLYRIINPSGFFSYSGSVAYEVGYLRTYAPADMLVPQNSQAGGITVKAEASVSPLKISEIVFDRLAPGGNPTLPSYAPAGDIDLVELTNISTTAVNLDGLTLQANSSVQHQLSFPAGIVLPAGGRITVQLGGTAGTFTTVAADELYFETGGSSNILNDASAAGIALYNSHNDVLDAVALNGYKFSSTSGVRIVHWNGDLPFTSGVAGIRRTTMTDHNNATDWEFTDASKPAEAGTMNPGLAATAQAPTFTWFSDDIPGWNASGSEVQLPILADGTYHIKARCTDNGYNADDMLTVTVYTPMAPVADFAASAVTVYPHNVITLNNLSVNYPDNYQWTITPATYNFINGTSAVSTSPQVKLNNPGLYTVTLSATNALGTSVNTKTDYITVLPYEGICVQPNQLNVNNVTANSATVSWSEGFYADSMQVKYSVTNGASVIQQQFTTGSTAQLNGLTAGTSYYVKVRPWCNGMASDGFTVKSFFATSGARVALSTDLNEEFSAAVFPNPSHGSFIIDVQNATTNRAAIIISDMAGKIVHDKIYSFTNGQVFPDAKLSPGIYMVKIVDGQNSQLLRLIVL
jgi:PKD repeat protein